jgi:hypothetical protein
MSDDEDIAALVIDNGSGMCKGMSLDVFSLRLFYFDTAAVTGTFR